MKLLTTKMQQEAIDHLNIVKGAIISGNGIQILDSIENLAELTYIIGGMKEMKKGCPPIVQ